MPTMQVSRFVNQISKNSSLLRPGSKMEKDDHQLEIELIHQNALCDAQVRCEREFTDAKSIFINISTMEKLLGEAKDDVYKWGTDVVYDQITWLNSRIEQLKGQS